jgi:hypothetical protein
MNSNLSDRIVQAFSKQRLPDAQELVGSHASLEHRTVLENFQGKRLHELPMRLTAYEAEDLLSMTGTGLRFYLPAFLRFLLTEDGRDEDSVLAYVIAALDKQNSSAAAELWRLCSSDERHAIFEWIEYILSNRGDFLLSQEDRTTLERVLMSWKDN